MPPGLRDTDPRSAARDSRDGARNASEPAPKTPRRPIERAARAFPAEPSHSRRGVTARAVNDTRAHVAITVVSYDVRARRVTIVRLA